MSDAEPELGLGIVLDVDERSVVMEFPAADETRRYAIRSAPLRRVRFAPGETVADRDGEKLEVTAVHEHDGLLVYECGTRELPEHGISDRIALGGPVERLLAARVDPPDLFDLRLEAQQQLERTRSSPVHGFAGARLELLPHQFYVASQVTRRAAPRVLLADETGLGKTIEACLVINRLLLSGRARRALILVPDSLVHQWLVELRRRFNLRFSIFDEDRCQAVDGDEADANPFLDEQLVLAGISLLAGDPHRLRQAAQAGWDVVVVDEAHRLTSRPDAPSDEYRAVETVAAASAGLLLLTATPEQLGEHGHFARLRLLDPERYPDFTAWEREAVVYHETAAIAERLLQTDGPDGGPLDAPTLDRLAATLGEPTDALRTRLGDEAGRRAVLDALVDRHGPGRAMFRNTRAVMERVPRREVILHALEAPDPRSAVAQAIHGEILELADADTAAVSVDGLARDPRIQKLVELLAGPAARKLLVICRSASRAQAIKLAIEHHINVDIALFHEELSLLQRDRNAAWFAQSDGTGTGGGARVMVCSEIGSEGRNFQHVQRLFLFDLPVDPDLVEQRIGRLDRIGQRGTVEIHVPYVVETGLEVLARWHHEGAATFARPTRIAQPLVERFGERLLSLAVRHGRDDGPDGASTAEVGPGLAIELGELIADTVTASKELTARLEAGRDRLLEMSSLRREEGERIIAGIHEIDEDPGLEDLFVRLLEHFHIYTEPIDSRSSILNPDALGSAEFPSLERGQTGVTFDRDTALAREELELMTPDHPLFEDALVQLVGSDKGNAAFALIDEEGSPNVLLEAVYVLETVAPPRLHVDRFLPPTPIRVVTDQALGDLTDTADDPARLGPAGPGKAEWIARNQAAIRKMVKRMTAHAEELAESYAIDLRDEAADLVKDVVGADLDRLRALAKVNDHVGEAEIETLAAELGELGRHVEGARLRLDALRLFWRGPHQDGLPLVRS